MYLDTIWVYNNSVSLDINLHSFTMQDRIEAQHLHGI